MVHSLRFLVFLLTVGCVAFAEEKLKCYTCLGRDYDSCAVGSVTCAGSCFKLVDEEHTLYAKGCHTEKRDDGSSSDSVSLEEVKLPWDENKPISGTAYYCSTSSYCNAATTFKFQMHKLLLLNFFILMLPFLVSAFCIL